MSATQYTDSNGVLLEDMATYVRLDGRRYLVVISTIYDDGDQVGPENISAVAPTIERAHAYVAERFNTTHMRTEPVNDDPLCSYRLMFDDEEPNDSSMTIWLHLVQLA